MNLNLRSRNCKETMLIFVRCKGKKYQIEADPSGTVLELKQQVGALLEATPGCMRMIYAGKVLTNGKSLQYFNLRKESSVMVMLSKPKPWKCRLCEQMNGKDATCCSMCCQLRYAAIHEDEAGMGGAQGEPPPPPLLRQTSSAWRSVKMGHVVEVEVVEAADLKRSDFMGMGKADPCELQCTGGVVLVVVLVG